MVRIPGFSYVNVKDDEEDSTGGIEIKCFFGNLRISKQRMIGDCHRTDEFEKLGIICEGSFGPIYKAKYKSTKTVYALKKYAFTPEMMVDGVPSFFLNQVNILKQLQHENIVNCSGIVAAATLDKNYLMLDYCTTSLKELMDKQCCAIYERDVVKYIMKNLFEGLSFVHKALVVHRNISCKHILFTEDGILKISGFRTATYYSKNDMPPVETDLTYQAPELLLGETNYGLPIDVWSAGCVFARLLLKEPLFTGESKEDVLMSVLTVLGTPSENIWPGFEKLLKIGTDDEKEFLDKQEFSDLKNIFSGSPLSSLQLIQDIFLYYPEARLTAPEVLQSAYIVTAPNECTLDKVASILKKALCSSEH